MIRVPSAQLQAPHLATMASAARAVSQKKRPASLKTGSDADGIREFMSNAKNVNHECDDEALDERLHMLKKKAAAKVKDEEQSGCEKHIHTNLGDSSMCGL